MRGNVGKATLGYGDHIPGRVEAAVLESGARGCTALVDESDSAAAGGGWSTQNNEAAPISDQAVESVLEFRHLKLRFDIRVDVHTGPPYHEPVSGSSMVIEDLRFENSRCTKRVLLRKRNSNGRSLHCRPGPRRSGGAEISWIWSAVPDP